MKNLSALLFLVLASCGDGVPSTSTEAPLDLNAWTPLPTMTKLPDSSFLPIVRAGTACLEAEPSGEPSYEVTFLRGAGGRLCVSAPALQDGGYGFPHGLDSLQAIGLSKTAAGGTVLILAGHVDSSGDPLASAKIYHDPDDTGFVAASDLASTITDLSPGTEGSSWTSLSGAVGGDIYLLDPMGHKVQVLYDSNDDDVPDTLATTPFVDSTKTHEIDEKFSLSYDADEQCLELLSHVVSKRRARVIPSIGEHGVRVRDTNGDRIADEYQGMPSSSPKAPSMVQQVYDGDLSVRLRADEGSVVEVHRWDTSTNQSLQLLGSGTAPSGVFALTVPSLLEGWTVVLKDATNGGESQRYEVEPASERTSELHSWSPAVINHAALTTVIVAGRNFDSTLYEASLFPDSDTQLISHPAVTVVSSTRLDVAIPANPSATAVRYVLVLSDADGIFGVARLGASP